MKYKLRIVFKSKNSETIAHFYHAICLFVAFTYLFLFSYLFFCSCQINVFIFFHKYYYWSDSEVCSKYGVLSNWCLSKYSLDFVLNTMTVNSTSRSNNRCWKPIMIVWPRMWHFCWWIPSVLLFIRSLRYCQSFFMTVMDATWCFCCSSQSPEGHEPN